MKQEAATLCNRLVKLAKHLLEIKPRSATTGAVFRLRAEATHNLGMANDLGLLLYGYPENG